MTLRQLFARLYVLIFGQVEPEPIVPPPLPVQPASPKLPVAANDEDGEFYFRETILDQLDYYMTCIARMRKADPEAFTYYSQLGGHIVPEATLVPLEHEGPIPSLSSWFRQTLPAFGAIFLGTSSRGVENDDPSMFAPRFVYFRKYDIQHAPAIVQRVNQGAVYVITVYWDDPETGHFGKKGRPTDFPVAIMPNGEVRLLRQHIQHDQTVRHKKGKDRGKTFTIPRHEWVAASPFLKDWSKQHRMSPQDYLVGLFVLFANFYEAANSSIIRVGATKNDLTASFGVNIKRTPYFFKDREVHLTESGRRKRIFHIVRPHVRSDGAAVKLHFRGERVFDWNGYAINISVPGKHHHNLSEFNVPLHDVPNDDPITPDMVSSDEIASVWKKHINEGKELSFKQRVKR